MTERPRRIIVVGGGVGGLATAIRLAADGHEVSLFERNEVVGGKLATIRRDGYTFDIGPSLVTLPHLFDELFGAAGTALDEHVDLVRLDPQFAYHWPDGSELRVHDRAEQTTRAFDDLAPGAGDQWRRFDARGRRIWDVSARTFLAGPMTNPLGLAQRMRSPLDLVAIDPLRTLHRSASRFFGDERLVQWAGRYATYSGSSPFRAPATLACIAHLEARFGCWYPLGGLDTIRMALEHVATEMGVALHTGAEVARIRSTPERVTGVELAGGASPVEADVVVADVDAEHLYTDLLPDRSARRRTLRAGRSTSGFVVCAAVRGLTPGIEHHNVWFSGDERGEFDALATGRLAADPTVYACVSAVTDPSQAPEGCENWSILINAPAAVHVDRDRSVDVVFDTLAANGVVLRDRLEFVETITPADLAERYRSPGGAIYGTSSNGRRAAFARPANRGPREGLYLVGGSSHPGGGLPLVLTSARIVAELIASDTS